MAAAPRRAGDDQADQRPELVEWDEGQELVIAEVGSAGAWIALDDMNDAVEVRQ